MAPVSDAFSIDAKCAESMKNNNYHVRMTDKLLVMLPARASQLGCFMDLQIPSKACFFRGDGHSAHDRIKAKSPNLSKRKNAPKRVSRIQLLLADCCFAIQ